MMPSHELPKCKCPWCGVEQDAATPAVDAEAVPKAGDLSICMDCCGRLVFNDDLTFRKPTDAENKVFDAEPTIAQMESAWRGVQWLRKGHH